MRAVQSGAAALTAISLAALIASCSDSNSPVPSQHLELSSSDAKPASLTVTSVIPGYGYQGETGKLVRITGTGFSAGAVAAWERNGVPDPKITVLSTTWVSSTQIDARINIAPDADLDLYDVSVMTADKGKGIGTERFEVTTAELIGQGTLGGNSIALALNERGDVVGSTTVTISRSSYKRSFYFDPAVNSMIDLGAGPSGCNVSEATGIDQTGTVIVGNGGGKNCFYALAWTRASASSPWSAAVRLPHGTSTASTVDAVAVVASTGVTVAGGSVDIGGGNRPVLWSRPAGATTWSAAQQLSIAGGTTGRVRDVNPAGHAAGNIGFADGQYGAVWENGTVTVLLPAPGTTPHCFVHGLSPNGQFAIGECAAQFSSGVYWARAASGAWDVVGRRLDGNQRAWAVNDAAQAVGVGPSLWQLGFSGVTTLPGLNDQVNGGARAISNSVPLLIVGTSDGKAVRWIR